MASGSATQSRSGGHLWSSRPNHPNQTQTVQTVKGVSAWRTYKQKCSKKCFQRICWNLQRFAQQGKQATSASSAFGTGANAMKQVECCATKTPEVVSARFRCKEFWRTHSQGHHSPHCVVQVLGNDTPPQILQKQRGPSQLPPAFMRLTEAEGRKGLTWEKKGQSCQRLRLSFKLRRHVQSRAEFSSWIHGTCTGLST